MSPRSRNGGSRLPPSPPAGCSLTGPAGPLNDRERALRPDLRFGRRRPVQDAPSLAYNLWHAGWMADTITFRPDEDALRALSVLTRDGTPVSTVVRAALIDAARARAAAQLRAEADVLAADAGDRAEAAQVLRDMETLRAW